MSVPSQKQAAPVTASPHDCEAAITVTGESRRESRPPRKSEMPHNTADKIANMMVIITHMVDHLCKQGIM